MTILIIATSALILYLLVTNYKLRRENLILKEESEIDFLTNCYSRKYGMQKLEHILSNLHPNKSSAVMFVDLDNFKRINDMYGHDVGDKVLIEATKRMREVTRRSEDILCRLGGDEFMLIIQSVRNRTNLEKMAKSILGKFNKPLIHNITIKPSIGISIAPEHGTVSKELLQKADLAMYCVKGKGKNNYMICGEQE